ncbi:hypothetical protein ACU4GD_29940 [Cupriavidus basilensis]
MALSEHLGSMARRVIRRRGRSHQELPSRGHGLRLQDEHKTIDTDRRRAESGGWAAEACG